MLVRRAGSGLGGAVPGGWAATKHARAGFATVLLGVALLVAAPGLARAQFLNVPQRMAQGQLAVVPPAPGLGAEAGLPLAQTGIPAEASAENSVVARDRAHAAGRRLAWDNLARTAGIGGRPLSDSQIEDLVSSIIIEQERVTPTRYSGRITVNFDGARVRALLSGQPVGAAAAVPPPGAGALPGTPASAWLEATATYRSFGEWLELRRRLLAAPPVANLDLQSIAVDAARVRLGLRSPAGAAAAELAPLGIALQPAVAPGGAQAWQLRLAGGG